MLAKCGVACILSIMSEELLEISRQERFDSLAGRIRTLEGAERREDGFGSISVQRELDNKTYRLLVFTPDNSPPGYTQELLCQELEEQEAHEGVYLAPISAIHLRRDKLDADGEDEKLNAFEEILNSI